MSCKSCKFESQDGRECRRYPKVYTKDGWSFPPTMREGSCGEFLDAWAYEQEQARKRVEQGECPACRGRGQTWDDLKCRKCGGTGNLKGGTA